MNYNNMKNIFYTLVKKNRSHRRFDASQKIAESELLELIDLARLSPSARNKQNLKFIPLYTPEKLDKVFDCMTWAGYLTTWKGPAENERPSAYIIICWDKNISPNRQSDFVDINTGIAAQTILLGAAYIELAGCYIGGFNAQKLSVILNLPEHLTPLAALALGKSGETVVLEEMQDNDVRYWRDEEGKHHVPKRPIDEIVYRII